MRKLLLIAPILCLAVACTTTPSGNSGVPGQVLIPLASGNYWIYVDSTFNDTTGAFETLYLDTVTLNGQTQQYSSADGNVVFYGVSDSLGWFGTGGYLGVDPSNTVIYGADSAGAQPYIFFETANADGVDLGSSTDYTNAACPVTYTLYGFVSTTKIGGFTSLQNTQVTTNCNGAITEQINTYVDPGIGVTRIVDYETATGGTSPQLSFTQTLQSYNITQ